MKKAFTLIELLVVISIISLIAVIAIPSFRAGQQKSALRRAAQQVAQDVRRAQNMAISGVGFEADTCGFGLHYENSNEYILFEDKSTDCDTTDAVYSSTDAVVESIIVPESNFVELEGSFSDILFIPPEPVTYIGGITGSSAAIILQLKSDTSEKARVRVTFSGRVSVE